MNSASLSQEIARMWADGKSSGTIAEELGITRNTVMGRIHRLKKAAAKNGEVLLSPREKVDRRHRRPRVRTTKSLVDHAREKIAPEPKAIPEYTGPVEYLQLASHHCRAIIDGVRGSDGLALSCGKPKIADSSYCAEHSARFMSGAPTPNIKRANG